MLYSSFLHDHIFSVAPDTIRTTPSGTVEKIPPPITRPAYDVPPSEVIVTTTYDMTRPPRGFIVSKEVTV